MLDIFSIDFQAKITKCILEKNESENIVTLDVSFYDNSDYDKDFLEDINFSKYYFLKSELISDKQTKQDKFSFKKEENILSQKEDKIEFEVINNLQVKVIKKQFVKKFKEDFLQLQYSFGLNTEQISLDFPFLKNQLSTSDKITVKNIILLENGVAKENVQDFRNLSYQKPTLDIREKYNKITVDTLFDKKVELSQKIGRKNSFLSKIYTTYGEEKRSDFVKTNVYLYFYIDSEEFVDQFCKYPKLIENPSEELKKAISISATINESTETKLCEVQECGLSTKYVYYRVKFNSEQALDKKVILKFFGVDFSVTKAREIFTNLSEVIRSLKEERWINAKFYVNKIPVIFNDNKKQILEIISTERRDIINQLIMNLQQIFSNYSDIMEGSSQLENVSSTGQPPAYSSNNVISFQKEVLIQKEKENYITIAKANGIIDSNISFAKLKNILDKKLEKYYDQSLTSAEASKEKTIPLENTKYSYLNFDVENLDKYFSIFGENTKEVKSIMFGLLQGRKLEGESQFKDSLLSNGITLQEEFVLLLNSMSQAASQLDYIFGTQKSQETKKVSLGNFDDTVDYSKIQNTIKSLFVLELLEEINKRDCELDYYNLKVDTFSDLKFALLDFVTSLAGESYLDKLPNSTKCLFGMFGKDSSKIKKDKDFFKDNLISYDKFFEFFVKYQFVFEIKYLEVGTNTNITQWKRLTMDRVNALSENEKLFCKLEVFEDDNIVSTKLLSKLNYSLRDEYFMMGK